MSGVDVLAVILRHADSHRQNAGSDAYSAQEAPKLEMAYSAVAGLIEAADRANGEHVAPHDCYATGPLTGDPILDLVACPGCGLSAALRRVKGEE